MFNDLYNSRIFAEEFSGKLKYCSTIGGWYEYTGTHWKFIPNGGIKKYSIQTYEKLQEILSNHEENDYKKLLAAHVKQSGNKSRLEAMATCAESFLSETIDKFDANENLFNCANGVLDLENLKILKHDPCYLLTRISPVSFISKSECPLWIKFVNDIFLGREEIIDFIQRYLGYALTTSTKEQCMCIFNGDGRNGKSTFIEIIRKIFCDYAAVCPTSTLIAKTHDNTIPNDIASLKGSRLVTMIETNQNVTLDEGCIKKLTGTDMLKVRFLHKEFFEFMPTFKIIFSSNHRPNIRGTDNGIWRRIRMIPFDYTLTDENVDLDLPVKLISELPGILLWIIEGYKKYRQSGLPTPSIIMESTAEYKQEEDSIGEFIEDECEIEHESYVPVYLMKERLKQYNKFLASKVIDEYFKRKGWKPKENRVSINGQRIRCFIGITLKNYNGIHKEQNYTETKWHD